MNVVERNKKRPLMVREPRVAVTRKSHPVEGEISSESDSSSDRRSYKTAYRNRRKKLAVLDTSFNVDSPKNDRDTVPPRCCTDRKDDKGTPYNLMRPSNAARSLGQSGRGFACRGIDRNMPA